MDGIPRAALGLGRSFIDTGNDGPLVKAYLARDPYNPVSVGDIVRGSLWRLALFYAFVCAILVNLWRSQEGRRVLALLTLNAAPVLTFAIRWQGAAIERYLLLYPILFFAFGYSLASAQTVRALHYASVAFVAVMAIVNLGVMAKPVQVNICKGKLEGLFVDDLERLQPSPGYVRLLRECDGRAPLLLPKSNHGVGHPGAPRGKKGCDSPDR
jgi:hypothetical protein